MAVAEAVVAADRGHYTKIYQGEKQRNNMTLIKKELLEILVCPADKAELRELSATNQLECTECGRKYPVKEGIPIMLIDESEQAENTPRKESVTIS